MSGEDDPGKTGGAPAAAAAEPAAARPAAPRRRRRRPGKARGKGKKKAAPPPKVVGPTKTDRRRVEVAAGGGMPHDELATALGVSVGELRQQYDRELSVGAHRRRMDVMQGLYKEARRGNVAAAKKYLEHLVRMAAPPAAPAAPAEKPEKVERVGKKEQRNLDAVVAAEGTEWEDLLPKNTTRAN